MSTNTKKQSKLNNCTKEPGCNCDLCFLNDEVRKVSIKKNKKKHSEFDCDINTLLEIFVNYISTCCMNEELVAIKKNKKQKRQYYLNLDHDYSNDVILKNIINDVRLKTGNKYKLDIYCLCVIANEKYYELYKKISKLLLEVLDIETDLHVCEQCKILCCYWKNKNKKIHKVLSLEVDHSDVNKKENSIQENSIQEIDSDMEPGF